MNTTYALYGVTITDGEDYIGTVDDPDVAGVLAHRWLQDYHAVRISANTLNEHGEWESTETVFTQDDLAGVTPMA